MKDNTVLEKYFQENILNNNSFYRRLEFWAQMLTGEYVRVNVDNNNQSYTNGEYIVLSPSKEDLKSDNLNDLFKDTPEILKSYMIGLAVHEAEHVNSSDFKSFKRFIEAVAKDMFQRGINKGIGQRIGKFIGNAIEDGRIERRAVNRLPGVAKHLAFINFTLLNEAKCQNDKITDVMNNILSLAKSGKVISDTNQIYKDTEIIPLLKSISTDIKNAVNSDDPIECMNLSWKVYTKVIEILEEDFKSKNEENSSLQNLLDFNDDIDESMDNPSNNPAGSSLQINTPTGEELENDSDEQNTGRLSKEIEEDNEDLDETNKSGSSNEENADSEKEEDLNKKIQDFLEEVLKDVEKEESHEKKDSNSKPKENKEQVIEPIFAESNHKATLFDWTYESNSLLDSSLKQESKILKKELSDILKEKKTEKLLHRRRGNIYTGSLSSFVAYKDDRVFYQKERDDIDDYVFYMMIDGSGSMCGKKENYAKLIASIIEESIKDLAPLRVEQFNSRPSETFIYRLKDFDTNRRESLLYTPQIADYCNCDAFALGYAQNELLKRPESRKVIFMITDGLPSISIYGHDASADTKKVVEDIRKKGILVIPIAICESNSFFDLDQIIRFREIYGNDTIFSDYRMMKKHIVKAIKTIINS